MRTLSLAKLLPQVLFEILVKFTVIFILSLLTQCNTVLVCFCLAGKSSITDYGTVEKLAEKLAAKRYLLIFILT